MTSAPTIAQQSLYGTITDEKGEALAGASIKVLRKDDYISGTSTDYKGKYRISLDPGFYKVVLSYVGYRDSLIAEMEIIPHEEKLLNIELRQDKNFEYPPITTKCFMGMIPSLPVDETSQGINTKSEKLGQPSKPN